MCRSVIGDQVANSLAEHLQKQKKHLPNLFSWSGTQRYINRFENVKSPESVQCKHNWNVEFLVIHQTQTLEPILNQYKGHSKFPVRMLEKSILYCDCTTQSDIDVTIIIGHLDLEKSMAPKLLLMQFQSKATNGIDNDVGNTFYETL